MRTFRWSYDLTFASYAFIVKRMAGPVGRVEWLEGGQASSPFELGPPRSWAPDRCSRDEQPFSGAQC